ncbi:glycosyltransferase family 2 protein [Methylobacterium sp. 17Sr1-1]|nr:glycosyltransferase family 2 protein [Methylobacterium sp. 17Sr1-1]
MIVSSAVQGRTKGKPMKYVAVTRILDEADIVEAFTRHTALFAGHHIFIDNGSNDGTLDILRSLQAEGLPITVFQNKSVHYNEREFNTFLYKEAVDNHRADWVIFLDADEFLDDRHLGMSFHQYFEALERSGSPVQCVKIPMVNYQYTRQDNKDEMIVPRRMVKRHAPSDTCKVIVSAKIRHDEIMIDNGSHHVFCRGSEVREQITETRIWLAHYSERSPFQLVVKFVRGWAKVLAAGEVALKAGASSHYRGPFEILKDRPEALLKSEWFMTHKNEHPDLVEDPTRYHGGELRYTPRVEDDMIAVRSLMGYLADLAEQHGRLIDSSASVRQLVEQWGSQHGRIL